MTVELANVAQSIIELAQALGEEPSEELMALAKTEQEAEPPAETVEFPVVDALGVIAKGMTSIRADLAEAKKAAKKYPYPNKDEEDEDKEKKDVKKEDSSLTAVLAAVEGLSESMGKILVAQEAIANAQPEETEKAKAKDDEEDEDDEEKKAVKKGDETTSISDAPDVKAKADDKVVAGLVKSEVKATLRRMGYIEAGAEVIPVESDRPNVLAKGEEKEQLAADIKAFTKLSFKEINAYRQQVGAL